MRLTRCFVSSPLQEHVELQLPSAAATHVSRVLRLRPGAPLTLFDGRGGEFEAQILSVEREAVRVRTAKHLPIEREAPVRITLLQALARGERMDLIVQKATELGVAAIVPIASEHSVVQLEDEAAKRRCEHWRQVAISACEQCGRNRIPWIDAVSELPGAIANADATGLRYVLQPDSEVGLAASIRNASSVSAVPLAEVALLIGPEGGWSAAELMAASRSDFQPCHLGRRVLRAETAPLVAIVIAQTLLGDFS